MTPNSTNTRQNIESVASRAAGNGARIRNLRAESSRNQVSSVMLVHKNTISQATPVGAPRRGHQRAPRSGQTGFSVLQKQYREPPVAGAVGGTWLSWLWLAPKHPESNICVVCPLAESTRCHHELPPRTTNPKHSFPYGRARAYQVFSLLAWVQHLRLCDEPWSQQWLRLMHTSTQPHGSQRLGWVDQFNIQAFGYTPPLEVRNP
jgi:hypothetical protein